MSSICWTSYEARQGIAADLRRRAYLVTFFLLLWTTNLSIVAFGLPFILIANARSRRKPAPVGKLAAGSGQAN